MNSKEKAKELLKRFSRFSDSTIQGRRGGEYSRTTEMQSARQCALICVEEILSLRMIDNMGRGFDSEMGEGEFWRQVKKEIQTYKP
jgi:hypothetical protein